ncbi:MAG TPA: hypothetical protein VKP13_18370 [Nitrospira sp.]|nr:hypothetical protein [Nitrospira sp.]
MYDMKNLSRLKQLEVHAPEAATAFWVFDKAGWAEGAIPKKYKELIAAAAWRAGGAITHGTHVMMGI